MAEARLAGEGLDQLDDAGRKRTRRAAGAPPGRPGCDPPVGVARPEPPGGQSGRAHPAKTPLVGPSAVTSGTWTGSRPATPRARMSSFAQADGRGLEQPDHFGPQGGGWREGGIRQRPGRARTATPPSVPESWSAWGDDGREHLIGRSSVELTAWPTSPNACSYSGQPLLQFLEPPGILNGDHRLVGEGFEKLDLLLGEGPNFCAANHE